MARTTNWISIKSPAEAVNIEIQLGDRKVKVHTAVISSPDFEEIVLLGNDCDFDIRHKPGRIHSMPDALRRYPVEDASYRGELDIPELPIYLSENVDMQKLQETYSYCSKIINALQAKGTLPNFLIRSKMFLIKNGLLYRHRKHLEEGNSLPLVIPEILRAKITHEMHNNPIGGAHQAFYVNGSKLETDFIS